MSVKSIKSIIEGLNKKDKVYIRFGELPEDGKSKYHRGDAIIKEEKGISVWDSVMANDVYFPVLPSNVNEEGIADYFNFLWGSKPVYLVSGTELSNKGSVGEPLLKDVKVIKDLTENYKYIKSVDAKYH